MFRTCYIIGDTILDLSTATVTMATSVLDQVRHCDNGIISTHHYNEAMPTLTRGEKLARQVDHFGTYWVVSCIVM